MYLFDLLCMVINLPNPIPFKKFRQVFNIWISRDKSTVWVLSRFATGSVQIRDCLRKISSAAKHRKLEACGVWINCEYERPRRRLLPPASYVIESSPLGIALVCVRLYVSWYPEACLLCFEKGKRYEDWSSALRCGAAPLYCRGGGKGCVILMACLFLSRLSLTALFDGAKCLESWTSEDLPQISDNFCALFAVVGTLLLVR